MAPRWRGRAGRAVSALFSSARRPPPDVLAVVRQAPGERLLTWGRDTGGLPLVATDAGLWAYGDRLAWTEIDHVGWSDRLLRIRAIDGETRTVALAVDRDLPAVIRAEIEASVVASRALPLRADGKGAILTARRAAGGEIAWRVRYDAGVGSEDPEVRAVVDAAMQQLRAELGI